MNCNGNNGKAKKNGEWSEGDRVALGPAPDDGGKCVRNGRHEWVENEYYQDEAELGEDAKHAYVCRNCHTFGDECDICEGRGEYILNGMGGAAFTTCGQCDGFGAVESPRIQSPPASAPCVGSHVIMIGFHTDNFRYLDKPNATALPPKLTACDIPMGDLSGFIPDKSLAAILSILDGEVEELKTSVKALQIWADTKTQARNVVFANGESMQDRGDRSTTWADNVTQELTRLRRLIHALEEATASREQTGETNNAADIVFPGGETLANRLLRYDAWFDECGKAAGRLSRRITMLESMAAKSLRTGEPSSLVAYSSQRFIRTRYNDTSSFVLIPLNEIAKIHAFQTSAENGSSITIVHKGSDGSEDETDIESKAVLPFLSWVEAGMVWTPDVTGGSVMTIGEKY